MSTDFSGPEHAQNWRSMEAEARLMAVSMADQDSKRAMLFVAEGYRCLAERAETLTPRRLIDGAAFGPDASKAIGEAFDAGWAEIVAIANEDNWDVEVLKKAALSQMALQYRESSPTYTSLKGRRRNDRGPPRTKAPM